MGAMNKIAVIGGGQIGEALVSGLVAAGREPSSIIVTNRSEKRGQELADAYGVHTTNDNQQAIDEASVVFLCVKPVGIHSILHEISEALESNDDTVVVSLAAGVTLASMEEAAPAGQPIVRVMPNTPMLVGKGMSACAPGRYVSEAQMELVTKLLQAVGQVAVVEESDMDAVTALAGSAPAYYFLLTEALVDAGVQLGLKRSLATTLASAAASGAGALLDAESPDPARLRQAVTSPAGTTAAALRELEESGLRGAIYRAAEKCAQRSAELGGLG
ncbi:Pyrroline-5-carboxylate reductase [Corynebacterium guangdongense]|nr:Pyrroline-5-carboxylate reductase [Corynebacterium guangdongense]